METILDRILHEKKGEIESLKASKQKFKDCSFPRRSLLQRLQNEEEIAVIAEFKRASPSKGVINTEVEPAEQAQTYEKNGASAISVLTDHTFFKGSYEDLTAVKAVVDIPVLCKDFIIDPVQIDAAAASGADLILLIAAAMDQAKLNELYQYARGLDLEVLLEVHNREELDKALITGARLIGVNNRDLKTFNVSLDVVGKLGPLVKKAGAYLISESGIHQKKDVEKVRMAGANGILVGESLMKSPDVKQLLGSFRLPVNKVIE
ncbi:indole-3-glycerol phosphate synthase TrpC [Bacillus sp. EB600]|uniref:indole-3-glycerol phosphate synthase TrpC n=1 Tax=Bacillus sp. EB600 TaxID=2806345 RepID=UPI00210B9A99|nr:indole-3-glycerol phosphate synthase TrpC [Bacillus sp. EB600]MCQ6277757.1 indole-3-glycerol phosphate synthase TrpC [Bacillus sp. EB600]